MDKQKITFDITVVAKNCKEMEKALLNFLKAVSDLIAGFKKEEGDNG